MDKLSFQSRSLSEISVDTDNINIVTAGLIIGKTEPSYFESKTSNERRGVITFTIRDSQKCYTVCKAWASREMIDEYDKCFRIYDIVNIVSPKVIPSSISKTLNPETQLSNKIFHPQISVPFYLVINQGFGRIENYHPTNSEYRIAGILDDLRQCPLRPLSKSLRLIDVNINGGNNLNQYVDLLVIIGFIKPVRSVRIRDGESRDCLEVVLIDKSFPNGTIMTIWHKEWIERAQKFWKSLETVLHLIDVRISYSTFYKATVLGLSARSVISENPSGKETKDLLVFAKTPSLKIIYSSQSITRLVSIDSIRDVMTVQQIYDSAEGDVGDKKNFFTAVLYAMVTKFDIDGNIQIVRKTCKFCKRKLPFTQEFCSFEFCNHQQSDFISKFEYYFDINLHLTDHTGTLTESRLSSQYAVKCLGLHPEEFQNINDFMKTHLKWEFLLETFAIKLLIEKRSIIRNITTFSVLDMDKIHTDQMAENILLY